MRMEFTPRHFLHLVSLTLLRTYFEQRRLLLDFDGDGLGESVEPLHDAWMGLPGKERHACWVDFETAFGLSSRRGIQTRRLYQTAPCAGKPPLADIPLQIPTA
jgi:hypothetical protein